MAKMISGVWFKLMPSNDGLTYGFTLACYTVGTTDDPALQIVKEMKIIPKDQGTTNNLAKYCATFLEQVKLAEGIK